MKPGSAYCTEDKYGGSDIKYTVIHYNHVKIKERSKLSTHMNNFQGSLMGLQATCDW